MDWTEPLPRGWGYGYSITELGVGKVLIEQDAETVYFTADSACNRVQTCATV